MTKKEIEKSIRDVCGGSLVTIQDLMEWSGRSREYVKHHIVADLERLNGKFYYSGDVAQAICRQSVR